MTNRNRAAVRTHCVSLASALANAVSVLFLDVTARGVERQRTHYVLRAPSADCNCR